MKKLMLCTLIGALVLAITGCTTANAYSGEPEEGPAPAPTEAAIQAAAPEKATMTPEQYRLLRPDAGTWMGFGFPEEFCTAEPMHIDYNGGEIRVPLEIETNGYRRGGLGILLFLDGQPQAYRTEAEPDYAYLHTVYPQEDLTTIQCSFIPVTGEKGQTLRFNAVYISEPNYFLDQGIAIWRHTDMSGNVSCPFVMKETPSAPELPQIPERILSSEISTRDLDPGSMDEQQLQNNLFPKFILNHGFDAESMDQTMQCSYGVTNADHFTFHGEVYGNPAGVYDLVLFVDNVPISNDPDKQIRFQTENGKKTVIDLELDLSDFDGSCVVYGCLIGQNFGDQNNGAVIGFRPLRPVYLSGAENLQDLMGWEQE